MVGFRLVTDSASVCKLLYKFPNYLNIKQPLIAAPVLIGGFLRGEDSFNFDPPIRPPTIAMQSMLFGFLILFQSVFGWLQLFLIHGY